MAATPLIALEEVAPRILPGSILVWRGGRLPHQRITNAEGRGAGHHVEMVLVRGSGIPALQCMGFTMWGPRYHSLRQVVLRALGKIDLYEPMADVAWAHEGNWDGYGAQQEMERLIAESRGYGWWHLLRLALRRMPMVRLLLRHAYGDKCHKRLRTYFCSHAVSQACRVGGGFDPVPQLSDWETQPADLARSLFFRRLGRLTLQGYRGTA